MKAINLIKENEMLLIYAPDNLISKSLENLFLRNKTTFSCSDKTTLKKHLDNAKVIIIDGDIPLALDLENQSKNVILLYSGKESLCDTDITVLQKPFHLDELEQKVTFLFNITKKGLLLTFNTPFYQFDATTKTLTSQHSCATFRLTSKEVELITYLYEKKAACASKEEILENIFGYKAGTETHTVETHIYKLRQKISDETNLIETIEGGYRLKTA